MAALERILVDHALPTAQHTAPIDGLRGYIVLEDGPPELGVVGAGGLTVTIGEDDGPEDVLDRLRSALPPSAPAAVAWPSTSPCGGAAPRLADSYPDIAFAARAEAPRPGDVVLAVGSERTLDRAFPIAFGLGRPFVLAVRDGGGALRALPLRLCADHQPLPPRVAGAVELQLVTTSELGVNAMRSTGHVDRAGILIERGTATAADLVATVRATAYDQAPTAVRAWVRANVDSARVVTGLEALLDSGAGSLAVSMAEPQVDLLVARIDQLTVTGAVEAATVRRGVLAHTMALSTCLERAAFDGGGDAVEVRVVWSGGLPGFVVAPSAGPVAADCISKILVGLKGGHKQVATGTALLVLGVAREDAARRPPPGTYQSLHGHMP